MQIHSLSSPVFSLFSFENPSHFLTLRLLLACSHSLIISGQLSTCRSSTGSLAWIILVVSSNGFACVLTIKLWTCCWYTRGRFESTRGGALGSTHGFFHGFFNVPYHTLHTKHTHNTTQHNTTQHNTTQHNTQHNTTQHNTTQHNTQQRSTTQNTPHRNKETEMTR